jgi:galactitol-specific phosphotransferase system IIC component
MRNFVLMIRQTRIAVVSVIIVAAVALGIRCAWCDQALSTMLGGNQNAQSNVANIKKIYVLEFLRMIKDKTPGMMIFDANGERTRARFGVIPGSRLLSSADDYDVAKELPANKNTVLVFYCADRH